MKGSTVVGLTIAVIALIALASNAQAAGIQVCLIDGQEFSTQADLIAHYQAEHPGVRVPVKISWH